MDSMSKLQAHFSGVADATYVFQRQLASSLRAIDRKALNAQVLVKRHGKELAGYGVVAQSFREGAQRLQAEARLVQNAISPLILWYTQALRDWLYVDHLQRVSPALAQRVPEIVLGARRIEDAIRSRSAAGRASALSLRGALSRFEAVVSELEYVVVNGRVEAALKGDARAALAQVSSDMDVAVAQVRSLLHSYRESLDSVLP